MDILAVCSVESVERAKTILWLNFCGSCWNVQGVEIWFLVTLYTFASVGFGVTLQLCEWTNGLLHMPNLCLNHQVHGLRVSYFALLVLLVGGRLTSAR